MSITNNKIKIGQRFTLLIFISAIPTLGLLLLNFYGTKTTSYEEYLLLLTSNNKNISTIKTEISKPYKDIEKNEIILLELQKIENNIHLLKNGGVVTINNTVYPLEPNQDQVIQIHFEHLALDFMNLKEELLKYCENINQIKDNYNTLIKRIEHFENVNNITIERIFNVSDVQASIQEGLLYTLAITLTLSSLLLYFLTRYLVFTPLRNLKEAIKQNKIITTDFVAKYENNDFLKDIVSHIAHLNNQMVKSIDFTKEIGEGNFDANYEHLDDTNVLGKSLEEMKVKLKGYAETEAKASWAKEGYGVFAKVLQENSDNISNFCTQAIKELSSYTSAQLGRLYTINENGEEALLRSSYGCPNDENIKFQRNEGLVGYVMETQQLSYIENIPNNYIDIQSGLGSSTNYSLIIVPLIANQKLFGIIELASFTPFEKHKIEFIEKLSENIAFTIMSVTEHERTQSLLEKSQASSKQLQQQEEEMRSNMIELNALQEEMGHKQVEMIGHLEAINKTIACIEFDINGNIVDLNEIYLGITGFEKQELIGKPFSALIPESEKGKPQIELMWNNLKEGKFFSGEFIFVDKNAKEQWLNGTFNPIFDNAGNPKKIMLFAHFTTDIKENENYMTSYINAIKAKLPVFEINIDGTFKNLSSQFTTTFGYSRIDVKKLSLDKLFTEISEEEYKDLIKNVQNGEEQTVKASFKKKNEEQLTVTLQLYPIKNLENKTTRAIGFFS